MNAGEWSDPPPRKGGRGIVAHEESANLARTRPGQWLKLPGTHSAGVSAQMRKGMYTAFKDVGEWEFTQRESGEDRRCFLWVRYVGPSVPSKEKKQ